MDLMISKLKILLLIFHICERWSMVKADLTKENIDCGFEEGFCRWSPSWSEFNWTRSNQPSAIAGSGPKTAIIGDYYVFFDTNDKTTTVGSRASLVSPKINQTPPPYSCLRFYYHMYGNTMGELRAGLLLNGDPHGLRVFKGDHYDKWYCDVLDLKEASKNERVFFTAFRGSGARSIIALDNFTLFTGVSSCDECEDLENVTLRTTTMATSTGVETSYIATTLSSTAVTTNSSANVENTPTTETQSVVIPVVIGAVSLIVVLVVVFIITIVILKHRYSNTDNRSSILTPELQQKLQNIETLSSRRLATALNGGPGISKYYSRFPDPRGDRAIRESDEDLTKTVSETDIYEDLDIYDVIPENTNVDDDNAYLHAAMSAMSATDLQQAEGGGYLHACRSVDSDIRNSVNSETNSSVNLISESNMDGYLQASSVRNSTTSDVPKFGLDNAAKDDEDAESKTSDSGGYLQANSVRNSANTASNSEGVEDLQNDVNTQNCKESDQPAGYLESMNLCNSENAESDGIEDLQNTSSTQNLTESCQVVVFTESDDEYDDRK